MNVLFRLYSNMFTSYNLPNRTLECSLAATESPSLVFCDEGYLKQRASSGCNLETTVQVFASASRTHRSVFVHVYFTRCVPQTE